MCDMNVCAELFQKNAATLYNSMWWYSVTVYGQILELLDENYL